jgi:pyruvate kinase
VDYVALSFVRRATDVLALRSHLERRNQSVPIIAKIEKPHAVENIHEIVQVAEGVMVARGDLGVEVPIERVPVYQKHIIDAAFRAGATVITATQMLDSMERHPRPTRAETTDIANAILDGTDAVMLSGETSTGRYPVESVKMMDMIAREVESSRFFRPTPQEKLPLLDGPAGALWRAACFAAAESARPLVIFTWSGQSALFASKARLPGPIFALTPHQRVVDQLSLVWGVTAIQIPMVRSVDELFAVGEHELLALGMLRRGQEIVIVSGEIPLKGAAHMMKIGLAGS